MKKIFVILLAGLLVPAGMQAQKVYEENGKVILDLTKEAGMPEGAITATSKTDLYNNATPNPNGGPITNNIESGTNAINNTVFQKLEIAPHNVNAAMGTMGATPVYTADWVAAFNACKNSTHNGDNDWRLPTQRELILIWIFKEALEDIFSNLNPIGSVFSSANYWSATESNASSSWYVTVGSGFTYYNSKTTDTYRVRCVREVTTP
jgi:hypothetical protein